MIQDNNKFGRKEAIHTSVYDLIDLSESQFGLLNTKVLDYNSRLPRKSITDQLGRTREYTKGKLRAGQMNLARQLIYLCLRQLEDLRTSPENDKYLNYLDENNDAFPITTNCGKLAKALGGSYCKNTIHNHLDQLIEAGIILHKNNTSRRRREVIDEQGYKTIVVELAKNGRGDFCLWLSRELFAQRYRIQLVENTPTAALNGPDSANLSGFESNENAGLSVNQTQKLGQYYRDLTETNKIKINNCSKNSESGLASQEQVVMPSSDEDELINRNDKGNTKFPGEMQGALAGNREKNWRVQRYEARRKADRQAANVLGGQKARAYFVDLLFFQLTHQLYPQYTQDHLQKIKPGVKTMLGLHLDRLEENLLPAFQKVSRAIYLAHRWLSQDPSRFVYEPFTYLRIDGDYKTGTLLRVIDQWLVAENEKLRLNADKNSALLKWQQAHFYSENLFKDVVYTLQGGFSAAKDVFRVSLQRLEAYFEKHEVPKATRIRIKRSFSDRCLAIFQELSQASEAYDPVWKTFERWRKTIEK